MQFRNNLLKKIFEKVLDKSKKVWYNICVKRKWHLHKKARRAITPERLHNMKILETKRLITNETGRVIDVDTFWSKEYKSYIMTVTPVKLIDHNGYITKSYCPADSYKVSIYQPSSGRQSKKALEQAEHIREAIYRHYAEKVANENGLTIVE